MNMTHHHGHEHHHHHHSPANYNRAFIVGITLNVGFVGFEIETGDILFPYEQKNCGN